MMQPGTNGVRRAPGRRGRTPLVLGIAVVAVAGLAWLANASGLLSRTEEEEPIEGAEVRRGPLRISVIERGNLKAADAVSLKSEIEGQATILFLVPEGTQVEAGQLLCELDVTSLVDKRFQQEIAVRNAEAAFVKAKQNYEIQQSQNTSDIKKAEQQLFFAETDLNKFREGERAAKEAEADESIKLAEEEYSRAEEKLGWSEKLSEKGFLTNTELEADRLSLSRAKIQLEQAKRDKDLLTRFQLPRDESELASKLEEAKRELDRVKLQSAAKLVDYDADMKTREAQLALEREKLDRHQRQIDKGKLVAPRAGMVVYAQEEGGRYGNAQPIKEGTQIRERQEIITIPSAAGMIAQASLHESVLKQVQIGQDCLIKVDALGPREFHGRVSFVAVLPDQNSWMANPNTRLYRTTVEIQDGHPEMRPGMSCQIEILVEDIADTVYAPVTSVHRSGGENLVFVRHGDSIEQRKVEVGRYNDRWVQILSGAKEGEVVLLAPPRDFVPQGDAGAAGETAPGGPGAPNGPPSVPTASADGPGRGDGGSAANGQGANGAGPGTGAAGSADASKAGERGGFDSSRMSEEMRKRLEAMTPEEREQMRQRWSERGGRSGGGGERGAGDRKRSGGDEPARDSAESKSDG
jgi:HlyD family secretion protein